MATAHRVLIVGPWRGGRIGGGCCSAGPEAIANPDTLRRADDAVRSQAGACDGGHSAADAVRALRSVVSSDVDVQLVDPRNTAFVVPAVYRDARMHGAARWAALTEAVRSTTPWAMVVDGVVVSRAQPLTPDGALTRLPRTIPRMPATR